MGEYTPRVGDKVRATLGESVIVGEVVQPPYPQPPEVVLHSAWVAPADSLEPEPVFMRFRNGWHFERLVSVPSKFGAVIRRADGALFARDNDPRAPWLTLDGSGSGATDEKATDGGFTVLFDGVDE